jgi:cytochrome P450
MYPPAWIATRVATTATELGGHPIAAGQTLVYSPYLIQHRPDVFEHPGPFDLDRWNALNHNRTSFFSCGGGARKCLAWASDPHAVAAR